MSNNFKIMYSIFDMWPLQERFFKINPPIIGNMTKNENWRKMICNIHSVLLSHDRINLQLVKNMENASFKKIFYLFYLFFLYETVTFCIFQYIF